MREVYSTELAIITGILIILATVTFALIQSPEILTTPERILFDVPHRIEGFDQCDTCHGIDSTHPYPSKHLGWNNASCTKCHFPTAAASDHPVPFPEINSTPVPAK